jgi:HTH-type transcriptional regulator, competence development regulator
VPESQATVATKIRDLRRATGMTQQDLAHEADLALRTVARIEGGEQASVSTLQAIARVFDVTLDELLAEAS